MRGAGKGVTPNSRAVSPVARPMVLWLQAARPFGAPNERQASGESPSGQGSPPGIRRCSTASGQALQFLERVFLGKGHVND